MDLLNKIRKKIKQVSIESKKYIKDKEHKYHKATGFLKVQIILLNISIVLDFFLNIYLLYFISNNNYINTIKLYFEYFGASGFLYIIALLFCFAADIGIFILFIIFLGKLNNKDSDFLLFYHKIFIGGNSLYLICLFIDFSNAFSKYIWIIILNILITLYYCTAVNVRVYFGGDEFLEKDYFIHFLLDEKYFNLDKAKHNDKGDQEKNRK